MVFISVDILDWCHNVATHVYILQQQMKKSEKEEKTSVRLISCVCVTVYTYTSFHIINIVDEKNRPARDAFYANCFNVTLDT